MCVPSVGWIHNCHRSIDIESCSWPLLLVIGSCTVYFGTGVASHHGYISITHLSVTLRIPNFLHPYPVAFALVQFLLPPPLHLSHSYATHTSPLLFGLPHHFPDSHRESQPLSVDPRLT